MIRLSVFAKADEAEELEDFLSEKLGEELSLRFPSGSYLDVFDAAMGSEGAVIPAKEIPSPLPPGIELIAIFSYRSLSDNCDSAWEPQDDFSNFYALLCHESAEVPRSLSALDSRPSWGKVYLIGFGPGDPELLTLKADGILSLVDEIYYDNGVAAEFLKKYPGRLFYVGKKKGSHSKEQHEINSMLFRRAVRGKHIARVKGGDPNVFGRGGEESEYLSKRFVEIETLPGITAACAIGAAFGIPLTKRHIANTLTITTAHGEHPNTSRIAAGETRIYYMATTRLKELSEALIRAGSDPNLPVAIARSGGRYQAYLKITSLLEMATLEPEPPVTLVIGRVVEER